MTPQTFSQLVPLLLVTAIAIGLIFRSRRGVPVAGRIIVRCNQGHLFTTLWVPFASFKAIRLGPYRIQYCPVGNHWAIVRPVDPSTLTPEEQYQAAMYQDSNIP